MKKERKMTKWIAIVMMLWIGACFASQSNVEHREVRIFQLLPEFTHPPLVHPCLPLQFVLGGRSDDPNFETGYYWGYQAHLEEYFSNPLELSGCIIHTQVSKEISQIGLDRFSNDSDRVYHLTALGLKEIKLVRGKWGIFPFREVRAKDPKGRLHYHLFVGLNTQDGQTLDFELIYPSYLKEPTQDQKKIWKDFVSKTHFLDLPHLLIAQEKVDSFASEKAKDIKESITLKIEKRRSDQKVMVHICSRRNQAQTLAITAIREVNFFTDPTCYLPYFEVDCILERDSQDQAMYKTFSIDYSLVDHFSLGVEMLYPTKEASRYIIF